MADVNQVNYEQVIVDLAKALDQYGDPESYFAIAIVPDRPSGWFADDVSDTDIGYRHGKLARSVLNKHSLLIERLLAHG